MRKTALFLALILSLALVGYSDNLEKQTLIQKEKLQLDPTFFWTICSSIIVQPDNWKCSFALIGIDVTLIKYGKWNFFGAGGGIAMHFHKNADPWFYDPYYYYEDSYRNQGYHYQAYNTEFGFYLKLVPVKYRIDLLKKIFHGDTYVEISFTTKKEIVFGLSFNWSFKKKKQKKLEK